MSRNVAELSDALAKAFQEQPPGSEDWVMKDGQLVDEFGLPVAIDTVLKTMCDALAGAIDDYINDIEVTMDNVTATFDSDIELPLHTGELLGDSLAGYILDLGVGPGIAAWLRAVLGPGYASKDADIDLPLEGTGKLE